MSENENLIEDDLSNDDLLFTVLMYILLEKYLDKEKLSDNEKKYMNRFFNAKPNIMNDCKKIYGEENFQDIIDELNDDVVVPTEEDLKEMVSQLVKVFEKKEFEDNEFHKLDEYLNENYFFEKNKELKKELKKKNYYSLIKDKNLRKSIRNLNFIEELIVEEFFINRKDLKVIIKCLEIKDSELNIVLNKIYDDSKSILGNSYLLYVVLFLYDLYIDLIPFNEYYESFSEEDIYQFYEEENKVNEENNLNEEILKYSSIEQDFIITTNKFLEILYEYYELFQKNIMKNINNLKLIRLMLLHIEKDIMDGDKVGKPTMNILIFQRFINEDAHNAIYKLKDVYMYNEVFRDLKNENMKNQYELVRDCVVSLESDITKFREVFENFLLQNYLLE
ncbi:MAG: hypothetical protein LBT66_03185 [Methanobrevibacter sp.]|jgi:hypothetical protein|nr:hypothetical protein [Candidatus Methanovirga meridionalis]